MKVENLSNIFNIQDIFLKLFFNFLDPWAS